MGVDIIEEAPAAEVEVYACGGEAGMDGYA